MAYRRPDGIEIEQDGDVLVVRRRWRKPESVGLMVAMVFFVILMILIFVIVGKQGWDVVAGVGIRVFGLGLLGAVPAYTAIAVAINTSEYRVGPERFEVRHGPLPWPGGGSWPIEQVEQFFVKERKGDAPADSETHYELMVRLRPGRWRKWMSMAKVTDRRQVERLEAVFEAALGIEDEPGVTK